MDTKLMIFDLDGRCSIRSAIWRLAAIMCWLRGDCPGIPMRSIAVSSATALWAGRTGAARELRTPETVAAVRADFVAYYTEHIDRFTRPYEGIPELLRELVQRGVRLAVASNKFQIGTEKLVRIYFPSIRFDAVSVSAPESRSNPIRRWCGRFSPIRMRNPGAVLYAGDSGVDMDTARAAGPVGRCDLGLPRPGGVV